MKPGDLFWWVSRADLKRIPLGAQIYIASPQIYYDVSNLCLCIGIENNEITHWVSNGRVFGAYLDQVWAKPDKSQRSSWQKCIPQIIGIKHKFHLK